MKSILVLLLATFLAADVLACAAITKKGTQCKRAPSPGSIYCWQHGGTTKAQRAASVSETDKVDKSTPLKADNQPNQEKSNVKEAKTERVQCDAITKKGARCSRMSQPGGMKCWQHAK